MEKKTTIFHDRLRMLMHEYVCLVYLVTKEFPKNEMFGVSSQYRRAAMSIILNYIEGYARKRKAVLKNFLEISYGSLRESEYLTLFSCEQKYLTIINKDRLISYEAEIGRMLWGTIEKL